MRLTDPAFEATFIARGDEGRFEKSEITGAQGVQFRCPCPAHHLLAVGFANPIGAQPHPSCTLVDGNTHQPIFWQMSGTSLADLTLSPSIDVWKFRRGDDGKAVRDGSCWHGHIQNGEVT